MTRVRLEKMVWVERTEHPVPLDSITCCSKLIALPMRR